MRILDKCVGSVPDFADPVPDFAELQLLCSLRLLRGARGILFDFGGFGKDRANHFGEIGVKDTAVRLLRSGPVRPPPASRLTPKQGVFFLETVVARGLFLALLRAVNQIGRGRE